MMPDKNTLRFVITHPQMGVYLGNCMGLGFWSKMDTVGQNAAVTFASVTSAEAHISSWDEGNNPRDYHFRTTIPDLPGNYVSLTRLIKDGYAKDVGELALKEQIPKSQLKH